MLEMILMVPLAFVIGMAFVAWRSWPGFWALVLLLHLGGLLALATALLVGSAAQASAPLRGGAFIAWCYVEVLLLGLLLAAAAIGALARGWRRLLARPAIEAVVPGPDRRWR